VTSLTAANPYPGLRPFDYKDSAFFFGRTNQIEGLRKKLMETRLVAVVGRSGCGKSSLVRAGLVRALVEGGRSGGEPPWRIAIFSPQGRPFDGLIDALLRIKAEAAPATDQDANPDAAMLRRSRTEAMLRRDSQGLIRAASELTTTVPGRLLIVIDQFEEIFRFESAQAGQADDAAAFVQLLVQAAKAAGPSIHIVLTMRLDFLGDCARFQGLPEAISQGQFLVPNLTRVERRAAIEEPARMSGSAVSAALTQRLLNELGDDPDELPVLQHVLMRTWQEARKSNSRVIDLRDYEATGGLKNAISRHATMVFDGLDSRHRDVAERLFKSISDLDQRGRGVRRPRRLGDIAGIAQTDVQTVVEVVEAFRAPNCSFLTPQSDPLNADTQIDISHESLLRRWAKMTGTPPDDGWLVEEDRNGKLYRNLLASAEAFENDNSNVLAVRELRRRETWMAKAKPNEAWAKRYGGKFPLVEKLLEASRRRAKRIRYQAAIAAVLVVGAVFTWIGREAWLAYERAEQEREFAIVQVSLNKQIADLKRQVADFEKARVERVVQQQQQIDSTIRRDAERQVQSDAIAQVSQAEGGRTDTRKAQANDGGYMWIGSAQQPNLQNAAGAVVVPIDVKMGDVYTVIPRRIFVRPSPPESSANYTSPPATAIIGAGSRVEARGEPIAYERPSGTQYWLPVRVVPETLSTVYFQFATAPVAQAQLVRQSLQAKGYNIPGEEQTDAARGQNEVRYRDDGDKEAAEQLAKDTAQVLTTLGYGKVSAPRVVPLAEVWRNKSPRGVLQLWLDLRARS
jgi:hypothetical protein